MLSPTHWGLLENPPPIARWPFFWAGQSTRSSSKKEPSWALPKNAWPGRPGPHPPKIVHGDPTLFFFYYDQSFIPFLSPDTTNPSASHFVERNMRVQRPFRTGLCNLFYDSSSQLLSRRRPCTSIFRHQGSRGTSIAQSFFSVQLLPGCPFFSSPLSQKLFPLLLGVLGKSFLWRSCLWERLLRSLRSRPLVPRPPFLAFDDDFVILWMFAFPPVK